MASSTSFFVKLPMLVAVKLTNTWVASSGMPGVSAQSQIVQSLPMYTPLMPAGLPCASNVVSEGVASKHGAPMYLRDA
jgi:hypothetical protein